jgi:hypothetical protein
MEASPVLKFLRFAIYPSPKNPAFGLLLPIFSSGFAPLIYFKKDYGKVNLNPRPSAYKFYISSCQFPKKRIHG